MEESKHVHERQLSIEARGTTEDRLLRPSGGVRSARLTVTEPRVWRVGPLWVLRSFWGVDDGASPSTKRESHIVRLASKGISSG